MDIIVGHTVLATEEILCDSCSYGIYICRCITPIYESEARENNLQCDRCGCYLIEEEYNLDLPDTCPNCGRHQSFLEILEDGSIECGGCFWSNK